MKVVTGTFAFDSSYASGGESITDIADEFKGLGSTTGMLGVLFQSTAVYNFPVDYTAGAEKVLAYNMASGNQASGDLSALTAVPFFAWGYIK